MDILTDRAPHVRTGQSVLALSQLHATRTRCATCSSWCSLCRLLIRACNPMLGPFFFSFFPPTTAGPGWDRALSQDLPRGWVLEGYSDVISFFWAVSHVRRRYTPPPVPGTRTRRDMRHMHSGWCHGGLGADRCLRSDVLTMPLSGKNYLFDRRFEQVAENAPKLELGSACCRCAAPCSEYRGQHKCAQQDCKVPVLVCPPCTHGLGLI